LDGLGPAGTVASESATSPRSVQDAVDAAIVDAANQPGLPAPGSMEAELLNTTDANRNQMLSLAISDARYECPDGANAKAAGNNGAVWRVHCGESNVYWVEVNEFGRLLVTPLPYGDFGEGTGGVRELRYEPQDRTLPQERTPEPIQPR
jgi:hypothetical protein